MAVGAKILGTAEEVFAKADMIVKVKPVGPEYQRLREGQILYTYLHLAPAKALTDMLLERKVAGVAYETITASNGSLPLLTPMSEVAGRMSVHVGAYFLQKSNGGRGVLLRRSGGASGGRRDHRRGSRRHQRRESGRGDGRRRVILDVSPDRMRELDDIFLGRVKTIASNPVTLEEGCRRADLLIGAVLIPGAAAPKL